MKLSRPSPLPQEYRIAQIDNSVSIDDAISHILSGAYASGVSAVKPGNRTILQDGEFPAEGMPLDAAVRMLMAAIGPDFPRKTHPGYLGYIGSPGMPSDPAGHALMSAYNHNAIGETGSVAITHLEKNFIRNIANRAGLPDSAGGVLCSGGTASNLSALVTAMCTVLGPEYLEKGIGISPRPIVLASDQAHFSIERACIMLGIGREGLVSVASDADYRMNPRALREALENIRKNGKQRAVCVVATAGTTLTGAIDPLDEIAMICREYGIWLHVDAAYGGAALFSDYASDRLAGIEYADSIAIDLHKWLYQAYSNSILLYRDSNLARTAFSFRADYLEGDENTDTYTFSNLSLEASRPARILPAILAFYHYGTETLGRNIAYNIECAEYLAQLVRQHAELELLAEPHLSICCFRFTDPDLHTANRINDQIIHAINDSGEFYLSPAKIHGKSVLRVCICNYTTTAAHMEKLVESVIAAGRELTEQPACQESFHP